MNTPEVTWSTDNPEACDTCTAKITDKFYDARTKQGPWACMCPMCFNFGPGYAKLGSGFGQEYRKQANGKFIKTAG